MGKGIDRKQHNGEGLKIGIVRARWNEDTISVACDRAAQALADSGVRSEDITELHVPGSYELPQGAQMLLQKGGFDAIIAVGVLIKGETMHFEYIAEAVTQGLMRTSLDYKVPVIFGVLTCLNQAQVDHRVSESGLDHGYEWGLAAVEMAVNKKSDISDQDLEINR